MPLRKQSWIHQYHNDQEHVGSNDDADFTSPIMDSFYNFEGTEAIQSMINFSVSEFMRIWNLMREYILESWNVWRGKCCEGNEKDILFMAMTALEHKRQPDFLEYMFNIN